MPTFQFPTPDHLAAALESMIDTTQRALDASDDKEERSFWRRQRNAYVNAQADVVAGRLPMRSGEAYLIPSSSRVGAYHRTWLEHGIWHCSCEAGERGIFHRHTALISAIEIALDMIERGEIGETEADVTPLPVVEAPRVEAPSRLRLDDDRVVDSIVGKVEARRRAESAKRITAKIVEARRAYTA